jgi:hypothetical protein
MPNLGFYLGGRYVDRFEKRNDEWRIAQRSVIGLVSAIPGHPPIR